MSYLKFDKTRLINLEYSLPREIMLANSQGAYCNTTIVGCNTRKYHGLLVTPVEEIDGGAHVLLSTLHETIIQHEQEFNLGIMRYPGEYNPKGHKYARWFESDPVMRIVYRVGGVVLQKELLLVENEARIMISYTLLEAHSMTRLRLRPFLAFRSIHSLSHANLFANFRTDPIPNGIKSRLYGNYPELNMQVSRKNIFVPAPDWYYKVEYEKERVRGYDFHEDLFVPGFFEFPIKVGESVIFTAGLDKMPVTQIKKSYSAAIKTFPELTGFNQILDESARKFIQFRDGAPEIISGFPWFGRLGRFSLIALPGLLLCRKQFELADKVLAGLASKIEDGFFSIHPDTLQSAPMGGVDTSLWFIWALQKYYYASGRKASVKKTFRPVVKHIIEAYSSGSIPGLTVDENGLLHAWLPNRALTWMDSYVDNKPVTQRPGYTVEVNGLWYNALSFAFEMSAFSGKDSMHKTITSWLGSFPEKFSELFWDEEGQRIADYVFEGKQNWDIRPNMVITAAMYYSPFTDDQKKAVLDIISRELLTTKGLRTLSPRDERFKQSYEGDHRTRDNAYHQGTVWPWLLGFFAEAWLSLYEESGKEFIQKLVNGFEVDMTEHGLCNISEVYDGAPPHRACGAISFAPSVAEILRIINLLSN